MPALRNAPKPPPRNIRLGSRILKGAPAAAPGPSGSFPGGFISHRTQTGGLWGGAGVTTDPGLARAYASQRTLRLADGPDEVHNRTIARLEFGKHSNAVRMEAAQ